MSFSFSKISSEDLTDELAVVIKEMNVIPYEKYGDSQDMPILLLIIAETMMFAASCAAVDKGAIDMKELERTIANLQKRVIETCDMITKGEM